MRDDLDPGEDRAVGRDHHRDVAEGSDGTQRAAADPSDHGQRDAGVDDAHSRLPPGQHLADHWSVTHYGRPPTFRQDTWDFQVLGATVDAGATRWGYDDFMALPQVDVLGDFHCVTTFSLLDNTWTGVLASTILDAAPPDPEATHVMVWADRGYTANLRLSDLRASTSILAHSHDGVALSVEHGAPLRLVVPHLYAWKGPKWVRGFEYLTQERRGFWEERGYHTIGDPWLEQRYSYQEDDTDG